MAERAVLARQCESGQWEVCRSQWGGTDRALAAVCAGTAPSGLPVTWTCDRTASGFAEAVAGLDYLGTELLYRDRRAVTPFLALWFGLPLPAAEPAPHTGAAVEVRSLGDARRLRVAFRRLKGRVVDALGAGRLPATVPPWVLLGALSRLTGRELYVVWSNDGSPW